MAGPSLAKRDEIHAVGYQAAKGFIFFRGVGDALDGFFHDLELNHGWARVDTDFSTQRCGGAEPAQPVVFDGVGCYPINTDGPSVHPYLKPL